MLAAAAGGRIRISRMQESQRLEVDPVLAPALSNTPELEVFPPRKYFPSCPQLIVSTHRLGGLDTRERAEDPGL